MIDCSKLTGHRKDMCLGHDCHGSPTGSTKDRIRWLLHWGYDEDDVREHVSKTAVGIVGGRNVAFRGGCMKSRRASKPSQAIVSNGKQNGRVVYGGPGTELKRIIAKCQKLLPWWDMQPHKGCGCNDTARWMDQLGPDGCEERITAIVKRLKNEARKRKITFPFQGWAAEKMVRWAIKRARKQQEEADTAKTG